MFMVAALAVALAFVWPLFGIGWYQNHDMVAYPVRAVEYVAGWRSGAIWPRWAPDLYGGYGCPLFNFYAPGLFIVSGLMILMGASATLALKLTLVLFTAVGAVCAFGVVWGECKRADAALVAATVFVFMGYHLTLVYVRGDLAEYCATCLTPAVLWSYRALGRVGPSRLLPVALAAALTHAATLLVHTLTGQWLTEFVLGIVGYTAWVSWRAGDRARAQIIFVTFTCACAMTAVYALPALLERPLVHIERMTAGGLATQRNVIEDLRLLHTRGFFYVGRAIELLPLLALASMVRRRRALGDVITWTLLSVAMVLLMSRFAAPLWQWLPFGSYIQFPWRLLSFLSLFAALAWGAAWRWLVPSRTAVAWPLAIVVAAAVTYDGWQNLPATIAPLPSTQVPTTAAEIGHGIYSTVISDEYLPRTAAARPMVPLRAFSLSIDNATVDSLLRSGTGYKLEVGAGDGASVELRGFWFPGWRVITRSGPTAATLEPSPLGYLRLKLPQKGYYRLLVQFQLTPLRAAATVTSYFATAVLLFAVQLLRRRARDVPPPSTA